MYRFDKLIKTNKMKKQVIYLALTAVMSMTLMSCMSVNFGNGDKDTTPTQVPEINQVTTMQPFDEVEISGAFKIVYEQGAEHSVRIEASEQSFQEMTVYVKGDELRIRKAVAKPTASFKDVKVYVTSPDIKKIDLAGSGMFAAKNAINTSNNMNIDIAGSGNVLLTAVTCNDMKMDIAGSGNIEIGNLNTKNVDADIAGSGDVALGTMNCKELIIDIAGSGDVTCEKIDADKVNASIAGSGDVNLKGTVRNVTKDIAGSGKVNVIEVPIPEPAK